MGEYFYQYTKYIPRGKLWLSSFIIYGETLAGHPIVALCIRFVWTLDHKDEFTIAPTLTIQIGE